MARGYTGVATNVVTRIKKANRISCNCERCYHSKRGAGTLYCTYYDVISPKRKTCARYWCVKPMPKNCKTKTANKQKKKDRKVAN